MKVISVVIHLSLLVGLVSSAIPALGPSKCPFTASMIKGSHEPCTVDADCIDNKYLQFGLGNTIAVDHVYYCMVDDYNTTKPHVKRTCQRMLQKLDWESCEFNEQCYSQYCAMIPGDGNKMGMCLNAAAMVKDGGACVQWYNPFDREDCAQSRRTYNGLNPCVTYSPCASGLYCMPNNTWNPSDGIDCSSAAHKCSCRSVPNFGSSCAHDASSGDCLAADLVPGRVADSSRGCKNDAAHQPVCFVAGDIGSACSVAVMGLTEDQAFQTPYNAGCLPGSVCIMDKCVSASQNTNDPHLLQANYDCTVVGTCISGFSCRNGKCQDVTAATYDCNSDGECGADFTRACIDGACRPHHSGTKGQNVSSDRACAAGLLMWKGQCETANDHEDCTSMEDCTSYNTITFCNCGKNTKGSCAAFPLTPAETKESCTIADATKSMDTFCCYKRYSIASMLAISGWFVEQRVGWTCNDEGMGAFFRNAVIIGIGGVVLFLAVVGALIILRRRSPQSAGYQRVGGH